MGFLLALSTLAGVAALLPAQEHPCQGPPDLGRAMAAAPAAPVYGALGAYFGQRQPFLCSIKAFESALRLDPTSLDAHYNLGLALLQSGEPECEQVVRLDPTNGVARLALVRALTDLAQYSDALYCRSGNTRDGMTELLTAKQLQANDPDIEAALRLLRDLSGSP
jgi:tetratricopeptide (TPR) repeat protein